MILFMALLLGATELTWYVFSWPEKYCFVFWAIYRLVVFLVLVWYIERGGGGPKK